MTSNCNIHCTCTEVIVEVESLCVHTDTENAFVLILSVNTRNSAVTTFQVLKEMLMSNNWPPIYLMLNGDIFSQFSNKFPSTCSSVDALDHRIYFWNSKVTWTFIIYVWGMRNNENAEQFVGCFLIQYVGTWFPWFQGHPLISGAMPLESGAGFA